MDDIPPWAKSGRERSRGPISRVLNAFLNTGDGGTVYMGVVDEGHVLGLNFTQYRKDHIKVELDDVMASYKPPVERHRYKIKFVPVVEENATKEEIDHVLSYDATLGTDRELRQRAHVFRTHNYCWCDKDSVARFNNGFMSPLYVVEVTVKPWDPEDTRNQYAIGEMKGHPIHQNEEGKMYFRRQASVVQHTAQEVLHMSRQSVADHYKSRIDELKKKIEQAKKKDADS